MKAPTLDTSCVFGGALPLARRRGALRMRPGETGSAAPVDKKVGL